MIISNDDCDYYYEDEGGAGDSCEYDCDNVYGKKGKSKARFICTWHFILGNVHLVFWGNECIWNCFGDDDYNKREE